MPEKQPLIGILAWDDSSSDKLSQLESMPGNLLHPRTFDFPVCVKRVKE